MCCRIIFIMLHIPAPLQNQCFHSFFAQFLRRPASADTGTYYDGIKCMGSFKVRHLVDGRIAHGVDD
jgi:hypothetical protein